MRRKIIWGLVFVLFVSFFSGGYFIADYFIGKAASIASMISTRKSALVIEERDESIANKLLVKAKNLLGKPYVTAGRSEKGFDCSGFVQYIYKKARFEIPSSSMTINSAGVAVLLNSVIKGDILVFTGTNSSIRQPGHVGIVLENNKGKISFIHSSSNGGVKISQVNGTVYQKRFLQARRILPENTRLIEVI